MQTPLTSALLFAALAACAGIQLPGSSSSGGSNTGAGGATSGGGASAIVGYTNDARMRNGLPALTANPRLMEAARLHAEQMAMHQRLDHTISEARYPTMQTRLQAAGYAHANAAENIAWNQPNAQSAVTTWMNSSGHRSNILDPQLTEIGTAMARSSRGEPYWIQVFGRPR